MTEVVYGLPKDEEDAFIRLQQQRNRTAQERRRMREATEVSKVKLPHVSIQHNPKWD